MWAIKQLNLIKQESGIRQPASLAANFFKRLMNEECKPISSHVFQAVHAHQAKQAPRIEYNSQSILVT